MRYQDWLEEWLAVYIKPTSKYKTYHRYEAIIRQRLIPKLGGYDLQDLTPLLIQRYIMELLQSSIEIMILIKLKIQYLAESTKNYLMQHINF